MFQLTILYFSLLNAKTNIYRVRKYGAGDKIPRHKYGVYSKEWPLEREKIIAEAKNKMQKTFTKPQLEQMPKKQIILTDRDSCPSNTMQQKMFKKLLPYENTSFKSVTKLLSSVRGIDKNSYIAYPTEVQHLTYNKSQKFLKFSKQIISSDVQKKGTIKFTTQGDKLNEKKYSWYEDKIIGRNVSEKR